MPQFGAVGVGIQNKTGVTTPSTAVGTNQILPSPTIWGSCDGSSLRDNPDGFFFDQNFKDVATAPGLPNQNGTYTIPATGTDSALNIAYTSTGVATVFIRPLLPINPATGNKLWFETSLNLKQSTAQHIFIGLASSTGLSSTLLASSTTLLTSTGLIGFWMHADAPTNFDAVYQNAVGGAVNTVLASVLTAAANNPDPANPLFVPSVPPGAITGNQGFLKLGVSVLKGAGGSLTANWYVNGTKVASQVVDSTFDLTDSYGAVLAFGTGTSNTDNAQVSFVRAAARIG